MVWIEVGSRSYLRCLRRSDWRTEQRVEGCATGGESRSFGTKRTRKGNCTVTKMNGNAGTAGSATSRGIERRMRTFMVVQTPARGGHAPIRGGVHARQRTGQQFYCSKVSAA
jgi:hypothetical protein